MQIGFQIATTLMTLIAMFMSTKWKMMLVFTINNLMLVAMYFSFGRIASACICGVAALRTIVFMIFALKKLKPNIFVLLFFELAFVACTVLTWQDTFDLLPLFGLLISGFASWQNNEWILRIGYVLDPLLFLAYNAIIRAWIAVVAEIIALISATISLNYYCVWNQEKPILERFDFLNVLKRRPPKSNKKDNFVEKQQENLYKESE